MVLLSCALHFEYYVHPSLYTSGSKFIESIGAQILFLTARVVSNTHRKQR